MTLAFWLGRGVVICANAGTTKQSTAQKETKLRLRELMIFLLSDGFGENDIREFQNSI
jgi:hypothetical protein